MPTGIIHKKDEGHTRTLDHKKAFKINVLWNVMFALLALLEKLMEEAVLVIEISRDKSAQMLPPEFPRMLPAPFAH